MLHYGGILMVSNYRYTSGFTLIELMISLVLGLLITAAVMQIYLTNTRTAAAQKSGSELQDASLFGLQQLESHLRLANLGNPITSITNETSKGGIVVSLANITTTDTTNNPYLTHTAGDSDFKSTSNITEGDSDQLTIQYINTTGQVMSDCESADIALNDTAIERYFVRSGSGGLVLACDAGRLTSSGITGLGANAQDFILGVDQFKVLLGTQTDAPSNAGLMQYLTSNAYLALTEPKPPITAIKLGLIVRGSTPVIGNSVATSFKLFGQTQTLKSGLPKVVRTTYESTTLLRNARVINIDTSTIKSAGS